MKQLQRPRLNAGQRPLIRIRELAFDSCGGHSVAVAGSAFIRFRQELLQQPQIAGIVKLHQFCPVFQLCGGDSRELLHIYGVLGFVTEYAIERRRKGMGIVESAYSAAQVRLRPILMTVLTMIFGMLPLMFSSGAGANGNSSLGTGVVGGMLVGTLALLFVVPVFYIIFEFLQEKIRPPMEEEADVQVLLEKEKSEAERSSK